MPRAVETYGARRFWPANEGPAKLPRKNASTCDGAVCPLLRHFSPASTASERRSRSGNAPNGVFPMPITITGLMSPAYCARPFSSLRTRCSSASNRRSRSAHRPSARSLQPDHSGHCPAAALQQPSLAILAGFHAIQPCLDVLKLLLDVLKLLVHLAFERVKQRLEKLHRVTVQIGRASCRERG